MRRVRFSAGRDSEWSRTVRPAALCILGAAGKKELNGIGEQHDDMSDEEGDRIEDEGEFAAPDWRVRAGLCQISKDIVDNYRSMFESRISTGATEKLPTRASGESDEETISSRSFDMEVTRRNVWKDIAHLQIKRLCNYTKSQRHAWMTINLKKRNMNLLENYLLFAHKLF